VPANSSIDLVTKNINSHSDPSSSRIETSCAVDDPRLRMMPETSDTFRSDPAPNTLRPDMLHEEVVSSDDIMQQIKGDSFVSQVEIGILFIDVHSCQSPTYPTLIVRHTPYTGTSTRHGDKGKRKKESSKKVKRIKRDEIDDIFGA
jgi:hypothetical protein